MAVRGAHRKLHRRLVRGMALWPQRKTTRRYIQPVRMTSSGFKELLFQAAVAATLILIVFGVWRLTHPGIKIKAPAETVAAFRVPYKSLAMLKEYAEQYGIPFPELFVLFCAENNFFPEKTAVYDLSVLEDLYVRNFDLLKRKYNSRSIAPYFETFDYLFSEIEYFPIPSVFDDEEQPSYMYGDSWGVTRNFEGDKSHLGADILDRENIRGRIPVISMTEGSVQETGWHDQLGYYIGIMTENGTYYLYAHFDYFAANITHGCRILPGQLLGYMGDSGSGKEDFQVHLHIGISPKAGFSKNRFWINPYPLLRYIEESKAALVNAPLF